MSDLNREKKVNTVNPKRCESKENLYWERGFSLVELMASVAIVGIVSAMVYPSYVSHAQKARREDGKIALLQLSQQLERCFSEYEAYNNKLCAIVGDDLTVTATSPEGFYGIATSSGGVEKLTETGYTLYATPTSSGAQVNDSCGVLSIDNLGNKGPSTSGCWE